MADPNKNRFYYNNEFRLYDIDGIYLSAGSYFAFVDDPIGFDGVQIRLTRGEEHGVNYEFSDGEINLQFDIGYGKEVIDEIFKVKGPDARIDFEFYDLENNQSLYRGRLNLADAEFRDSGILCPIERANFDHLFRTRYETKVNLFDSVSLDGNNVGSLQQENIQVYGKAQTQKYEATKPLTTDSFFNQAAIKEDNVFFTPGFPNVVTDEFSGDINPPALQFWNNSPVGSKAYLYQAVEGGLFKIDVQVESRLITETQIFSNYDSTIWGLYLEIVTESGDSTKIRIGEEITERKLSKQSVQFITASFVGNNTVILNRNDEVYLYHEIRLTEDFAKNFAYKMDEYGFNQIKITGFTAAEATTSKAVMLFDALRQSLRLTTNVGEPFFSEFFGFPDRGYSRMGGGANNILTLGRILRNFDLPPLTASFKELYESLDAIFCLGLGIDGTQLRIEPREYFYQQSVTKTFTNVGNYRETVAKDLLWNEIKVGFKKYLEEEINTLDSVHQEIEYLTPLRATKNKLQILSDIICDSYAIEETRRQQFEEEINDNWRYDDDLFLIAVNRPYSQIFNIVDQGSLVGLVRSTFPTDQSSVDLLLTLRTIGNLTAYFYNRDGQEYKFSYPVNEIRLVDGKIAIEARVVDGLIFRFVPVEFQYQIKVEAEEGLATERNNPFEYVDNVFSPSTFTNLRHSLGNIIRRWSLWINSSLSYKEEGEEIKTTFVKGNSQAITKFNAAERNVRGNPDRLPVQEGQNILLSEFGRFGKLFSPIFIEFETDLSWAEIDEIRNSPYGLFQVTDFKSQLKSGWLQELTYNKATEKCEFKLLMKNPENLCQLQIVVQENENEYIVQADGAIGVIEYQAEEADGTIINGWQDSNIFQKAIFPSGNQIIKAREKTQASCEVQVVVNVPDNDCGLTLDFVLTDIDRGQATVRKNGELVEIDPRYLLVLELNGGPFSAGYNNPQNFSLPDPGTYVAKVTDLQNSTCQAQAQLTIGTEALLTVTNFTYQNNKRILNSEAGTVYSEEFTIENKSSGLTNVQFAVFSSVDIGSGMAYQIETGSTTGVYSGTSYSYNSGDIFKQIPIAAGEKKFARIRYTNTSGATQFVETLIREDLGDDDFIVDGVLSTSFNITQEIHVQEVVEDPLIQINDWLIFSNRIFDKSDQAVKFHGVTEIINSGTSAKLIYLEPETNGVATRIQVGTDSNTFSVDELYTGGRYPIVIAANTTRYLRVQYDNQTGDTVNVALSLVPTDGRPLNVDGTLRERSRITQTLKVDAPALCLLLATATGGDLVINAQHSYTDGVSRTTEYRIETESGGIIQDWQVYGRLLNYQVTSAGNYIVYVREQSNPQCIVELPVTVRVIPIEITNFEDFAGKRYWVETPKFRIKNNTNANQRVVLSFLEGNSERARSFRVRKFNLSGVMTRSITVEGGRSNVLVFLDVSPGEVFLVGFFYDWALGDPVNIIQTVSVNDPDNDLMIYEGNVIDTVFQTVKFTINDPDQQ